MTAVLLELGHILSCRRKAARSWWCMLSVTLTAD